MAYTDVVLIMGRRLEDFEDVFIALVEQSNKMGLEINLKKTKFIILSRNPYNEHEYVQRCKYT
jgi:predicted secreted acid phosphatase